MTERKLFSDVQPEDELLPSEIAAVEAEVQKEIDKEAKAEARAKLKAQLKLEAKRKRGLAEQQAEVVVDLPPYSDRILIDNVAYLQGMTYTVPASRAAFMREMIQNAWKHQSEIDGKSENFYRRMRGTVLSPAGATNAPRVNTTSQLLKA